MGFLRWKLSTKLFVVGITFLVLALGSTGLTLWVSWQLEGGAAAVNEAGRLRMMSYRLALALPHAPAADLQAQAERFEHGLDLLEHDDPRRPLFVPRDEEVQRRFEAVKSRWEELRGRWLGPQRPDGPHALDEADAFVILVDDLVSSIEHHLSRWTALLHVVQFAIMGLALASAVAMMYTGYLLVLEPLARLQRGLQRLAQGDFSERIEPRTQDEFGDLAQGFNRMAEQLGQAYGDLEAKVREKTARLEVKRERLSALYEISSFVSSATSIEALMQGFAKKVRTIAKSDAVAVRWSDASRQRFVMAGNDCLPPSLAEAEGCLAAGQCHCGTSDDQAPVRVIPIHQAQGPSLPHCEQAGYRTLVTVPVRTHQRTLGEIDLFFRGDVVLAEDERGLYEAMGQHLAGAMEALRAAAIERESAVAEERTLLARELHDSIAQSLAFLKLQVPLLRHAVARGDAQGIERVLGEIEIGIRESNADVRELLLHFRTRAHADDIEVALRTTLQKFEHQTGIAASLEVRGPGLPLDADVQIQVLHVVQEALSNVRKHARATHAWVEVEQQPVWRCRIRDDGRGFDARAGAPDSTHVGLAIMRERAARIGASIEVQSAPGEGTSVVLTLPPRPPAVEQARVLPAAVS